MVAGGVIGSKSGSIKRDLNLKQARSITSGLLRFWGLPAFLFFDFLPTLSYIFRLIFGQNHELTVNFVESIFCLVMALAYD
ncbi:hypothetical protein OH492_24110 [Vibrio chagasii]|nr:hypothetical protein [Vibrio chagasii]